MFPLSNFIYSDSCLYFLFSMSRPLMIVEILHMKQAVKSSFFRLNKDY